MRARPAPACTTGPRPAPFKRKRTEALAALVLLLAAALGGGGDAAFGESGTQPPPNSGGESPVQNGRGAAQACRGHLDLPGLRNGLTPGRRGHGRATACRRGRRAKPLPNGAVLRRAVAPALRLVGQGGEAPRGREE